MLKYPVVSRQRLALQRDQRRGHSADAGDRRRRPRAGPRRTRPHLALRPKATCWSLIGREAGHLGQSLYQLIVTGKLEGAPPPVDLADEIKAGNLVRSLIREGKVRAVHDVSDGGLLVAVAEMALAGGIGVQLFPYEGKLPAHAAWFGEDQGRYVAGGRARSWPRRSSSARVCWRCPRAWSAASAATRSPSRASPRWRWTICARRTRVGCRATCPMQASRMFPYCSCRIAIGNLLCCLCHDRRHDQPRARAPAPHSLASSTTYAPRCGISSCAWVA